MQEVKLTSTSYIVLGLLELGGESTPYGLKQLVAASVGNFWTLHHAQLYSEPERLAKGGYVSERREEHGRRRKLYELTARGRRALDDWRREPETSLGELREPAVLKLFFGAGPAELASVQIPAHEAKLAEYEAIRDAMPDDVPDGPRLALEAGIRHERSSIEFWQRFAG
jgi:PadR family transcriptional regulator, regulatory protein AphA